MRSLRRVLAGALVVLLQCILLAALVTTRAAAQASAFSQLRNGALRGLREVTLYINIDAPGMDQDSLRTSVRDTVAAMLRAEGLEVHLGGGTREIVIYPALFVEILVMDQRADSLLLSGSITLIEGTQLDRMRMRLPAMTWGVRNRPRLPRVNFQFVEAEALAGSFIHDLRCGTGRLGECTSERVP